MTRSVWKGPFVHPSLLKKIDKLKDVPKENTGLSKLPTGVRNKMGFKNRGGIINNGKSDYRKSGMFYKGDK